MKRILRYFRARRFERDLQAELQAHLDEKAEELAERGIPQAEASAASLRQFGNRTLIAEICRERWTFRSIETLAQDLRYTVRILRKSPAFAVVAILSLALGIGANTLIFSAVHAVLLRPLPYPAGDRLFAVWSRSAPRGAEHMYVSAADFYDWQKQSRTFQSMACYANWPMNLTGIAEPQRLEAQLVSADFFATLGASAAVGRSFATGEDQESSPPVVVISNRLSQTLGPSAGIVGRRITLNGSPATVIGVMPRDFRFPSAETDVWLPLSMNAKNRANREGRWLRVIGRLKAGVSVREAAAEMDVVASRLASVWPATNSGWGISLVPLQRELAGNITAVLLTLQGGALILLLITCVNLANLLLARGTARAREIAVRAALGAGRARIVRQLVVESAFLAALGGGLGVALAAQGTVLLRSFGRTLIPRSESIAMNPFVALFGLAATATTTLVFGLAPALAASRVDLRGRSAGRHVERNRSLMVAAEMALASVLLTGAGLLGTSLIRLLSMPPGFRAHHILTMRLTLPRSVYPTNESQIAFFGQLLERTAELPGVVSAGEVSDAPLSHNNPTLEFVVAGLVRSASDPPVQAALRVISAGYLNAAGIALISGREFTPDDRNGGLPVVMVNETMARRYWPGANPLGRSLRFKDDSTSMIVVGVTSDIRHMGLDAEEGPVVYLPYAQKTQDWLAWTTLVVHTSGDPLDLAAPVRNAIRSIDRNQPASSIATLEESLARSTAVPRFTTFAIGTVSAFALLIALVGVYGLVAYTVSQRTAELGIRLTLGASAGQVVWLLLRQALVRVAAGIAAGIAAAWMLSRWLESLLAGARAHDIAVFATVTGLLLAASLAAVWVPAARVLRLDPALALRSE